MEQDNTAGVDVRPIAPWVETGTLDALPVPAALLQGPSLGFRHANPAFAALPLAAAAARGRPLKESLPGLDADAVRESCARGGAFRLPEVPIGAGIWDLTFLPLHGMPADHGTILLMAEDALPRVEAKRLRALVRAAEEGERLQQALQASELRQRVALSAAAMGEWDLDLETGLVTRSALVDRLFFGQDASGTPMPVEAFLDRIHPDDRTRVDAEIRLAREIPQSLDTEFRILRPDGVKIWAASRGESLPGTDGRPRRLIGVLMDITHRKLEEQALAATLAEKDAALEKMRLIFGEVNHRVKNSLQLVASLLNLQGRTLGGEEAQIQFGEAYRRVLTVAAVHERLYRTEKISSVEFGSYLAALCHDAERAAAMQGRDCTMVIDSEEAELPTDKVVPLALISNELIANALKHAFPEGGPCEIEVRFARRPEGGFRLVVADRGAGLPAGFDPAASRTLGMKLVKALTRQIEGRFTVEAQTPGARFTVTF